MKLKILIIFIIIISSCKKNISNKNNSFYDFLAIQSESEVDKTQTKVLMGIDKYSNEIFVPPLSSSDFLSTNKKDKDGSSIFDSIPLMMASATEVSRFDLIEKADKFAEERARLQAQIDEARKSDREYQENLRKLKSFTASDIKSLDGITADSNKTPSQTPNPSFFNSTATISGPIRGLQDFKIELLTDFGTNGIARNDSSGTYIYVVKVYKAKAAVFVTVSYNLFNQDVKDLADLKSITQADIKAVDGLTINLKKVPSQQTSNPAFSSRPIRVGSVEDVIITLDTSSVSKNDDTGLYSYLVTLKKNAVVWNNFVKYDMLSKKEYYGEYLSVFTENDFKNNDGVSPNSRTYPNSLADPSFSFPDPYSFLNPTVTPNVGMIRNINSFNVTVGDVTKDNNAGIYFYRVKVEKSGIGRSFYITYRNLKSSLTALQENKELVDAVTSSNVKNVDGINVSASVLPSQISNPSFSNLANGISLQLASSHIERNDIDGQLFYYVVAKKENAVSNPIKVSYSGFKKISLTMAFRNGLLSLSGLTTNYTPSKVKLYKVLNPTSQLLLKEYNTFLTAFYQKDGLSFYRLSLSKMQSVPSSLSFSRPYWNVRNKVRLSANLTLNRLPSKILKTNVVDAGVDLILDNKEIKPSTSVSSNQSFGSIVELSSDKKYMVIASRKQNSPIRIYKRVLSRWSLFDEIPVPRCSISGSSCSPSQSIWKINSVKILEKQSGAINLIVGNIYASHNVQRTLTTMVSNSRYGDFQNSHTSDLNAINTFDSSNSKKGEIRIYESDGNTIFKLRTVYSPSDISANAMFGWSLGLEKDPGHWNFIFVVSAPFVNSNRGRVYIMKPNTTYSKYIESSIAGERLGWSFATFQESSSKSKVLAFTSHSNSSRIKTGETKIYEIELNWNIGTYSMFIDSSYSFPLRTKVVNVSNPINKQNPNINDNLNLQYGVVADAFNGKIAIGFPNNEKVLLIEDGINGTQTVFTGVSPGSNNTRHFGQSLQWQGNNRLLIGAPAESETGTGYFPLTNDKQSLNSGAAYIIEKSGSNWTREAYLKPILNQQNMKFGSIVRWSGTDTVIISSPSYNNIGIVQEY